MKALYVFIISVSILFVVGCDSNITTGESAATNGTVYDLDQTTSGPIKLDTFQCSGISVRKGAYKQSQKPGNKHFVKREKDSVTYSGIVYVTHKGPSDKISYHSYQYYFKATKAYSDAYVKYNTYSNEEENGEILQKISTQETGYHLDFGYKKISG